MPYIPEPFTERERTVLARYFTNLDGPVTALVNLPEVVKGALFARYSRSAKSIRRLFLDEFVGDDGAVHAGVAEAHEGEVGVERADRLYERVFSEYGDDSVAQLGGAHLACEQASNVLTKVLEWGRLAAYLEQSTRYIYYDQPFGGRYRYVTPPEVAASSLAGEYARVMDGLFETYSSLTGPLARWFETLFPREEGDSAGVWRATIRARVCDELRGLLPAATFSNVGIFAPGQSYEALLLRMRANPLQEVRDYADLMLVELRKVIPSFLKRVDLPDRGVAWSRYLASIAEDMGARAARSLPKAVEPRPAVTLVEWDPDAEVKVAAAALYAYSHLPDDQLLAYARGLSEADRAALIGAYVGQRGNRRHKPGRAMERVDYRFDVLCDYGAFRDLQRHRMLTLEWQALSPLHGYDLPAAIEELGEAATWHAAMGEAESLYERLRAELGPAVAQFAVPFACKVRFYMQLNAREAFHLLELRTAKGGHESYRAICQEMHRLIREQAGHTVLADAMSYVDYNAYDFGRIDSERRAEARRAALGDAEGT
jgi:thymidylate synthase ThyX